MKVKLSLKEFTRHLQIAMRAIAVRPTLPILNYMLMEAEDGKVMLTGYDMEMGIRVKFPAEVIEAGSLAVKAKTLNEIVTQIPAEDIELDFNDISKITISGGRSEFQLVGKPGGEYPSLPDVGEEEEVLTLPIERFMTNLKRTIFASSLDMPKNYTSGILLAMVTDKLDSGHESEKMVLIPSKTMHELLRILGMNWEGNLELHLSENLALFRLGDNGEVEIITHLLDTPYPDYEKVIPEETTGSLTVDRNRLIASLRQVGILARQQDGRDMSVLETTDDHLKISSKAESEGKAEVEVPIEREGEPLKVAFNYQYLLDPLLAVEDEKIVMKYSGSLEPGIITIPSDDSYTYVVMPVRLPE
jgi:DNA polymerase-3 subunit beta